MGARTAEYGRSKVTERNRNEVGVLEIVQFLTGCLAFFGKDLLFLHLFFKIRPALSSVLRCSQSEKRRKYEGWKEEFTRGILHLYIYIHIHAEENGREGVCPKKSTTMPLSHTDK